MKKLILCSVLLLCMLAGSTASMASDKIHVVSIGNSITYGATLSSPSTEAPPVITGQQLYKRTRVATRVKNCGVSGITTFGFLPGRSAYNTAVAAAAEFAQEQGPLYFSIMLGTNDSAEKGPEGAPVSTDTYKNNLKSIIDSLKAKFPQAKFILNYPIWYSPTTHNGATYLQAGLDRLNSYHPVIDNIVSEYSSSDPGKVYAGSKDAYSFFENNTQYFTSEEGNSGTFYLHPNAQGAVKLAGFWTDAIMQVLATDGIDEYTGSDETWLKGDDLITDTLQITSNTMESWKFSPANLIRPQLEGYSTGQYIYHSAWTDPLPQNESPYLQVHLKEAQSDIFFMMISSEWAATYDTPRDVVVMATNTPDDEDSWQEVCELQDLVTEIQHPVIYYSPHIALGGEYTDLRFVVKATVNNRKSSTGSLLLSLGRFQVIKAEKADTPYRKLLMLLDEMSEKGMDYQSGTQPGYYSEQAVNNLIEAYEAANYAASQSLTDEEYASAEQNLRNAYNAVEASLVKITDGYYYIVSAYPAFAENNVGTKAMYVSGSETLRWATLDEDNPGYLFKITMSDDSICNIQSVYSGRYVNTLASQFTDAPATMQLIKRIGTTPQFTIANVSNTTPYHCQDHKEGAGTEGVICAWSGKADTPSAWYLVAQNDAEKISALEQEGEQAYRSDRVLAAVKSTRDSRLKADDYEPYITDGSQITANSMESSQFTPANLIRPESDGYGTGQYIFHTSWSSPLAADVMPYLQVHLLSPESSFIFKMISSEWAATYDTPNSMSILATNTPDDEDSWVNVKQLDNMIPDDQKFSHPTKYTSAMIDMAGEYSDVRFVVNSTVNNRLASTGIFYLSLGRFQMYTGVDPETVQYNYNPEVTAAADTLKSLIDAGAAKTVNNLTAGDITALRTAIDNLNNAYADTTSLAAYYRKMMTRAENFTVGEEIGEADSEESVAAFLSALQTAHALVNSRQPMKADIAKAIEGITEAYDTMLEHVNKLQAGKWYYIVSECSSDYCSGKAMMATSADYGSQVHFGQNDKGENDPAYIENPFAMWRFMPVEGTPYYSIQNLATSHSVAATSDKGVSIQRTPAPYRVDYIGAAELQFVPVGEGNAEEYQLNAQASDTLVVLQNAELGGASSWTVVPVEDDAYLKFPIAANSIGIMTLPFDIPAGSGSVMQMNPNVTTYSVKSVEVSESLYSSVITLTKTEEIKAGGPFVIVEGNTSDYSQNLPMSSIYTTLPADVDTTSRKANALVGTLGGTVLSAGGYGYFANNAVEISGVGQVEIPGMSGWIDAGNAVCEDGNADLVINVGGIINSISDLTKEFVANGKTKVYTIDGVYVGDYSGFAAHRAKGLLPKGIYIVSGRKVMVK